MRPSPTIPSSMSASVLLSGHGHAVGLQILPQLRRTLKMNRTHPELPRALQIQCPVINEQTFFRAALGYFQSQTVDSLVGLPLAHEARAEKSFKLPPQIELFDPSEVEFERLVVDRCKKVFSCLRQPRKNRACFWQVFRLFQDKGTELIPCKFAL